MFIIIANQTKQQEKKLFSEVNGSVNKVQRSDIVGPGVMLSLTNTFISEGKKSSDHFKY